MDSITNLLLSSFLCSILVVSTTAVNTISTTQSIKDGDTIVSIGGSFALGFFSPGSSKNRYAGIWYNKISNDSRTVVWVANRETPVTDSSGILMSFDYPTDTFLPGMKFGIHYETALNMSLWSWQSSDNPAQGDYTYSMDSHGFPQYFLRKDTVKVFRSGPWNGVRFSGMPSISSNPIYNFTFVLKQNETYFNYDLLNSSVVTRMVMNQDGVLRRMTNCPECVCLQGFEPKFPKDWGTDWSNGCVGRTPLNCSGVNGDMFWKYYGVKVPDTENSWFNVSMTLKECETMCLKNCSCMAYANSDVSGEGSGCLLWFDELVDIESLKMAKIFMSEWLPLNLHIVSELGQAGHNWNKAKTIIVISVVSTATLITGLGISLYISKKGWTKREESHNEDIELPLFHLVTITKQRITLQSTIRLETADLDLFTGMLEGRQEIAVKLLSKYFKQGVNEFKNEVICTAKLQH
ncbi:hypothetical protein ACSBR1_012164 [Camellia fascicularis]